MKIGFIGCGNMAKAMLRQMLASGIVEKEDVIASTAHESTQKNIAETFGIRTTGSNCEAAEAKLVFLAVKPQMYPGVLKEISSVVSEDTVLITMAPGKSMEWAQELLGKPAKIVRTMPNTPAQVGAGVTGFCCNEKVTETEAREVTALLNSFGDAVEVPEHLMNIVGAISGASPAFMFMCLEALADGAVAEGMPRAMAYRLAAGTMMGCGKMMLDTGMHPGQLKDMVCSPAGTTIEGVAVLEEKGVRSAMMQAVRACVDKSRKI